MKAPSAILTEFGYDTEMFFGPKQIDSMMQAMKQNRQYTECFGKATRQITVPAGAQIQLPLKTLP